MLFQPEGWEGRLGTFMDNSELRHTRTPHVGLTDAGKTLLSAGNRLETCRLLQINKHIKRSSLLIWLEENNVHLHTFLNPAFLIMKTFWGGSLEMLRSNWLCGANWSQLIRPLRVPLIRHEDHLISCGRPRWQNSHWWASPEEEENPVLRINSIRSS